MFLSMFYAKRFSAYYFNSIRKLCFSILDNSNSSNNNNKNSTHLLWTIECTQQCHSLHFPTCIFYGSNLVYCVILFRRYFFYPPSFFCAFFSSIHRRVYFFLFWLGACLPSIFPTSDDSLHTKHCFILFIFSILVWILSILSSDPSLPRRNFSFSLRLYLTCHLYFRIRFFKPINLTLPLVLCVCQAKKGAKQKLPCVFFTLLFLFTVATTITTWNNRASSHSDQSIP